MSVDPDRSSRAVHKALRRFLVSNRNRIEETRRLVDDGKGGPMPAPVASLALATFEDAQVLVREAALKGKAKFP